MNDTPFRTLEMQLEVPIDAPPARVWQALVEEIGEWWPRDFYTGEDPEGFHLEPRLGGRMYEDWGHGQGLVWATVIGIRHERFLQLVGDSTAEWGGPSRGFHTFRLEPTDGGGTTLRFTESIFGVVGDSVPKSLEEGWRHLLDGGLRAWVEKGERLSC